MWNYSRPVVWGLPLGALMIVSEDGLGETSDGNTHLAHWCAYVPTR
jgi:hypothetical protein